MNSDISFGGFTVPRADVQVFDVFIRYSESLSDSRSALARGACGGEAGCEYTRVHEGAELYCRPVTGDYCEVEDDTVAKWNEEYQRGLSRVWSAVERRASGWLERLIAYVQKNPPSTFCFLREWLCDLRGKNPTDGTLGQIAYWLVQDWRIAQLTKPCRGCGPDTGIRLGRAWVWKHSEGKRGAADRYTTLYIKNQPPFRRLLAADEWPETADAVNLGQYVWQTPDTAAQMLRTRGMTVTAREIAANNYMRWDDHVIVGQPTEPVNMYWRADPLCGDEKRVIYFDIIGHPAGPSGEPVPAPAKDSPLMLIDGMTVDIAERLKKENIEDLAQLTKADPAVVAKVLAELGVTQEPAETFIARAGQKLSELGR